MARLQHLKFGTTPELGLWTNQQRETLSLISIGVLGGFQFTIRLPQLPRNLLP